MGLGWECPRCHSCYASWVFECPKCSAGKKVIVTTDTGGEHITPIIFEPLTNKEDKDE